MPLSLVQAGGTIGPEVITQRLLPQKDQRHMLVLSRPPPERDLIKRNKTSYMSIAIHNIYNREKKAGEMSWTIFYNETSPVTF